MRKHLLDTGPLSAYAQGRPRAVHLIQPWITAGEAATIILVYGEIVEYWKSTPNFAARERDLRGLLRAIYPYRVTYAVLNHFADVRRALCPPYGPGLIGDMDTLIAATARERDLTLVTIDTDFQRVPGLRVQVVSLRA